jgi:hypothetical protein
MRRLLPFLLLLFSSAVLAESGAYRVEVIVFQNLGVTAEALEIEELRSFSQFPELEESRQAEDSSTELPGGLPRLVPNKLPDDVRIITRKSAQMDGVWRRLRSSRGYRPLVYAAWDQNRTEYYPPMRVHNGQIIDTQFRPPGNIVVADLAAEDPLAAYRSTFYQLDGSVQLRRSRFLHLFLDLEYRIQTTKPAPEPGFFGDGGIQTEPENGEYNSSLHEVIALKQNRQIRTGRLQYFDTPYFGALVFVSAIPAN